MDVPILSVSQFVAIVNQNLETAFPIAQIEGEISGFRISQDKWVSFNLKDETADALVGCWGTVWQIKNPLEDGMKVVVSGRPQLRAQSGRFSIKVERVTPTGEGALKRAFEMLRAKLETEGLFDEARKRPLPSYPRRLGLITAVNSEAYKDFTTIITERWVGMKILVVNVQVQGLGAPEQIIAAIDYFNQLSRPVEALAIVRGGGSLEDLQAFNEEQVARAVASSRTPTVVGVGHEGDISLADLASDQRAATPTDAAKRLAPDKAAVAEQLTYSRQQLESAIVRLLQSQERNLHQQTLQLYHQIDEPKLRLQEAINRLRQLFIQQQHSISGHQHNLGQLKAALNKAQQHWLGQHIQSLNAYIRALKSVNPQLQLKRGYAVVRNAQQQIIRRATDTGAGELVVIQLAKDKLDAQVKELHYGGES